MAAWLAVVGAALAVGVPLIVGWMWTERVHRRRLASMREGLVDQERALEQLRAELSQATVKASSLAATIQPERPERRIDLMSSLSLVHAAMRARELELGAYRRRYRSTVAELAVLREKTGRLEAESKARLSEDQDFQLHLAQVTDERDRLRAAFESDPGFRAQRLQLKAAKKELEELRMKLRTANAAIVKLERGRAEDAKVMELFESVLRREPIEVELQ